MLFLSCPQISTDTNRTFVATLNRNNTGVGQFSSLYGGIFFVYSSDRVRPGNTIEGKISAGK